MPADIVRQILEAANREVLNQLDLARAVKHPGESGRAREQVLAAYLRRVIPADIGIDTGFVIDAQGGMSRQIDIVLYRTGYHPVFEIGGIKHFMVEGVLAVLENKASIATRDALSAAFANVASVKALDRSNAGKNYTLSGLGRGPQVDRDNFEHQIFGAIVTESSLARDTLRTEWLGFVSKNEDRRLWPNFYADVRGFSGSYMDSLDPAHATVIAAKAIALALTDPADSTVVAPLLELTFELVNYIRIAAHIDFSPRDYLLQESGRVDWWPLEG